MLTNKTQNSASEIKFPSEEEIKAAQRLCCGRCCNQCESPAEYAWRKRDVDLAILLEKAIENELSEKEKGIVKAYWFDNMTVTEIAQKRGIEKSTVNRTLKRSKDKLERVLIYTVCYQNDINSESIFPLALGRARVIAAARNAKGGDSGNRITRLRQSQNLSRKAVSDILNINETRFSRLEAGGLPSADELISLSSFFNVSTDFILKGESDEE